MDIRIPNLGEGADSGTVVSIYVKEGDHVAKDQTLIELENEKAVAPIPSTRDGVVSKIHVKVGDKVTVGQIIVSLGAGASGQAPKLVSAAPAAPVSVPAQSQASLVSAAPGDYQYVSKSGFPPPASPTVRKMASDLGIDLHRVKGTESGGRVSLADVKAYVQYLQSLASHPKTPGGTSYMAPKIAESVDFSRWGPVRKKAVSSLRQKIAQKMAESWATIPHVTQFEDVNITSLMELRKKYVGAYEKKGAKLTLTSFILKAVVAALKKYPGFNASLDENTQEIVYKDYYHLGVAVDTEQGLIVPVLKDVDKKNLFEISKDLETLAEKTRSRKVGIEDLKGGTFTISNLGGIGGTYFTPIINKPEVAILGVGKGRHVAWDVIGGAVGATGRSPLLMPIGLSYDHRVVDGADGARFVRAFAEAIENFSEKDVKQ